MTNDIPRVHVFFDSTEVYDPQEGSTDLGRLAASELSDARQRIDARLYVVDLVIEEFANKRLRELLKAHKDAAARLKSYASVGALPGEDALRQGLYNEISDALSRVPAEIVPTQRHVLLEDVLALANAEVTRTTKKKDLGFNDALIFLASLTHAAAQGLRDVWFVSADSCFEEDVLRRMAERRGITCRLFRSTPAAIQWMKNLDAIHLSSLEADFAKLALAFVNEQNRAVLQYLNTHPPASENIVPHLARMTLGATSYFSFPTFQFPQPSASWAAGQSVELRAAFPTPVNQDGAECQITFHGHVKAEVRVEEHRPVAISPSPFYGGFSYGSYGVSQSHNYQTTEARSVETVQVPIVGRGRATYRSRQFVGPFIVESVSVTTDPQPTKYTV